MSTNAIEARQTPGSIRARRLEAGLTQEQLARNADCSLAYVRVLEHGYSPTWEASPTLQRVAALLGLSAEDYNDDAPAINPGRVKESAGQGRRGGV